MNRRKFLLSTGAFTGTFCLSYILAVKEPQYIPYACLRCRKSWNELRQSEVQMHGTTYEWTCGFSSRGIVALCETCWAMLTPEERLPYYRVIYDLPFGGWNDQVDWKIIEQAVLQETSEPEYIKRERMCSEADFGSTRR